MSKERLLAYTDAVIAIVITIMVLEFKIPHGYERKELSELIPVFISYVISFIFISIYRNNHHHMFQAIEHINGKTLWKNNILLFFLSLIPFVTGWMAENHFATNTVLLYGIILLGCGISYTFIVKNLLSIHSKDSLFAKAVSKDRKGMASIILYLIGIALASFFPRIALGCYGVVALMRLIPEKRIEKILQA